MAILTLDKVDFTAKNKGSIHQDDIAILNAYAPKNRANNWKQAKCPPVGGWLDCGTVIP